MRLCTHPFTDRTDGGSILMVQVKRTMLVGQTLAVAGALPTRAEGQTMPADLCRIIDAAVAAALLTTILLSGYMVAVG
jgi:hypothetical protein